MRVTKQSLALGAVRIEAFGRPRTKGSLKPIHVRMGGGKCRVTLTESGEYSTAWKEAVIRAIRATCDVRRYASPVVMDTYHRFERLCAADETMEWPTRRPGEFAHGDDDKLRRVDGDACEQSGLILDDSLVIGGQTWKRWCEPGEHPGVVIRVRPALDVTIGTLRIMEDGL